MAIAMALCMSVLLLLAVLMLTWTMRHYHIQVTLAWILWPINPKKQQQLTDLDVTYVDSSPEPTKHQLSTPWPPTPTPKRRMRAGRRTSAARLPVHRRHTTKQYDPPTKKHCGVMTVLKAAQMGTSKEQILQARNALAMRLQKDYLDDKTHYGTSIKALVQSTDEYLASYIAKLKHDMLLAPVEVLMLAEELHIPLKLKTKDQIMGDLRAKNMIVLKEGHYTLWKTKKQHSAGSTCAPAFRGGMRSQASRSRSRPREATQTVSPTLPFPGPSQPTGLFGGFGNQEEEDRYYDENYGPNDDELDAQAEQEHDQAQETQHQQLQEDQTGMQDQEDHDSEHGSYDTMASSDSRLAVTSVPARPVLLTRKLYVKATATRGYIRATATADVWHVLSQVRKTKKSLFRLHPQPEDARSWYQVEFVHAQGRECDIQGVMDARWSAWEYLQQPRIVPLTRGQQLLSRNMVLLTASSK